MRLTHYMLEIYPKISVKITYLNYLGYVQQTISATKVPRYSSDKLLTLHGTEFKGKMLVIQKLKNPPKAKIINGGNQKICPQTQPSQLDFDPENTEAFWPLQRITNYYQNAAIFKKGDIVLFSDSMPRGINIEEINRQIQDDRIYVKVFPGGTFKKYVCLRFRSFDPPPPPPSPLFVFEHPHPLPLRYVRFG